MDSVIIVFCNVPDLETGRLLARQALTGGLAACVNLMPGVESLYRWQGALEQANEVTMQIKTVASRYGQLEAMIKLQHPYQVPEIVSVPVTDGLPSYLSWVRDETKESRNV